MRPPSGSLHWVAMGKVHQAGGIVVRFDRGSRRYLLVRSKKHPEHWIFPKGHVEKGESAEEAAVREVREEASVQARVVGPAGAIEFSSQGKKVHAEYFWMIYVKPAQRGEERESRWCDREEALALLSFKSIRRLLKGKGKG